MLLGKKDRLAVGVERLWTDCNWVWLLLVIRWNLILCSYHKPPRRFCFSIRRKPGEWDWRGRGNLGRWIRAYDRHVMEESPTRLSRHCHSGQQCRETGSHNPFHQGTYVRNSSVISSKTCSQVSNDSSCLLILLRLRSSTKTLMGYRTGKMSATVSVFHSATDVITIHFLERCMRSVFWSQIFVRLGHELQEFYSSRHGMKAYIDSVYNPIPRCRISRFPRQQG